MAADPSRECSPVEIWFGLYCRERRWARIAVIRAFISATSWFTRRGILEETGAVAEESRPGDRGAFEAEPVLSNRGAGLQFCTQGLDRERERFCTT